MKQRKGKKIKIRLFVSVVDSDFVILTVLQGARDTQEAFETIEGSVEAWTNPRRS